MSAGAGAPRDSRRRRWGTAVRIAVAVALLAWVGSSLPWRDTLTWEGADGERVSGEIVGDWRAERVEFLPDTEQIGRAHV